MNDEQERKEPLAPETDPKETDVVDENMSLFIYGNIKIKDVDTGEILVNKRF